ncbi:hypothetical protein SAMN06295970_1035 [Noviherbaspirillum suwonense]|uniref:Protocatechuate 3,4-dioxygenase n=1 Tax=Noviherbaspirillum suwonense TaxID=1224511 RepID=A0ABY1PYY2_9BURK|nr:hypothetical protein SAMN06295970_1035 [Noviherbaspirillum suwonense]
MQPDFDFDSDLPIPAAYGPAASRTVQSFRRGRP